jgi:hypothetical protein
MDTHLRRCLGNADCLPTINGRHQSTTSFEGNSLLLCLVELAILLERQTQIIGENTLAWCSTARKQKHDQRDADLILKGYLGMTKWIGAKLNQHPKVADTLSDGSNTATNLSISGK